MIMNGSYQYCIKYNSETHKYIKYWVSAMISYLVGGFNPSEKNISQIGNLPQIWVKIKHVWNHNPVIVYLCKSPLNHTIWGIYYSSFSNHPKLSWFLNCWPMGPGGCPNRGPPWKINGWNMSSWRLGSDHFPFFSWAICRFQPLIFQGVTISWCCVFQYKWIS